MRPDPLNRRPAPAASRLLVACVALLVCVPLVAQVFLPARRVVPSLSSVDLETCITITNTTASNLTNYPVKVVLDYTWFILPQPSEDGSDIVMYDEDNTTVLSHWIEKWDPLLERQAFVWVKVPLILANSSKSLFLHRGESLSDTSDAASVFTLGRDFADGLTTGLTISVAGSATNGIEVPTLWFGDTLRVDGWARSVRNPIITQTGAGWEQKAVRDFAYLTDVDGNIVRESDNIAAYYLDRPSTDNPTKIGRVTSTNGITWTRYGSNPVLDVGAGGEWDDAAIGNGSVIKLGTGSYIMYYEGYSDSANANIGVATSTDGLSWTKHPSNPVLLASAFTGPLAEITVPNVILKSDGTWLMVLEGQPLAGGWDIYAATSNDGISWSVFNSGNAIFAASSGWESLQVANPKIVETSPGNFFLIYAGTAASDGWKIGVAYSSDLTTWTKYGSNPVLIPTVDTTWENDAVESGFAFFMDNLTRMRESVKIIYQGFNNYHLVSDIGLGYMMQNTRLRCYGGTTTAAGWTISRDIDDFAGAFEFRITVSDDQTASGAGTSTLIAHVIDSASTQAPTTAASFNSKRRVGVWRRGWSDDVSTWNKFFIGYLNTSDAFQWWNGSSWAAAQSAATFFGGAGRATVSVRDDGTNYVIDIYDETGTTIITNPASIAKTSVKAFSNGRVLLTGDPYTDFDYGGQMIETWLLKPYVSPEPTVTVCE